MAEYHRPVALSDALALLGRGPVTVAAGCTDLFPGIDGPALRGPVLDITAIDGLRGIEASAEGWRIGATTTWSDLLAADLPPAFDMLKAAAREVGSVQIQNTGTVAGNLCNASPAADGVPPLLALDASVELTSTQGTRALPLERFLTGVRQTGRAASEMVTAVTVPRRAGAGVSRFLKLGARRYLVISIAMIAARLVLRDGRIAEAALAVGACSPVARRLPGLEARLAGCSAADVAGLAPGFLDGVLAPIADVRGSAAYRGGAAEALVRRCLLGLMEGAA